MADASYHLLARDPDDVLFRAPGGVVAASGFLHAAHRLAAELPAGSHVLNLCQDRYAFSLALAAAMLRGQVSLLSSDRSAARLGQLAGSFPGLYAVSDEPKPDSTLPIHPLTASLPRDARAQYAPNPSISADKPAAIVFTSGSTGEPIGHRKTWGALATRSADAARRFRMLRSAPASVVGTVPPQHMYGFETTVLLPFHAPASSWCGGAFYPSDVQAALDSVPPPRILVTTPLQIRALLQAAVPLPPIERVISATAQLSSDMARQAEEVWRTRVDEIFGATEVGSIASRRTVEDDIWTLYPRVRLFPAGSEQDEQRLLIVGPHAERQPLNDVVEVIDRAHFRLVGRPTDLIKLGGRRASLAGLNRMLTSIDGVVDGLFVAPEDLDQRPSARLLAFVVAPGRDPNDILAALRERIDPLFLPRRIVAVETLPRNEVGKLPDQALQALRVRSGES
ncbi:MAG: acyl-CoA synthetase [Acetobacteraceae bacterium]|nr:acyl-CoA synthetase [Acetobacteraceae bacterium]